MIGEIVKVQMSLFSSTGEANVLIYNKEREDRYEGPPTKSMIKKMGKEYKKYFWAAISEISREVRLLKEAPWQDW